MFLCGTASLEKMSIKIRILDFEFNQLHNFL